MEQKTYFVYQHKDLNGNVFYIGKGTKQKTNIKQGYERAYSIFGRSKNWKEVADKGFSVEIIYKSSNEENVILLEQELILKCEECINTTILTNFKYDIVKIDDLEFNILFFDSVYKITKDGKIFNKFGVQLSPWDNGNGYKVISLNHKGKRKNLYVHRLIAECFIPNPDNLPVVNHKDCNKNNNNIENLEWCTTEYNIRYASVRGRMKRIPKIVLQYDLEGNFIKEWESVLLASQFYNCTEELIQQAASVRNKKSITGRGYLWIYKEDFIVGYNLKKINP